MIKCINCRFMHQHADPRSHRCTHPAVEVDLCRDAPVDCVHHEERLSFEERARDFETAPVLEGRWIYESV